MTEAIVDSPAAICLHVSHSSSFPHIRSVFFHNRGVNQLHKDFAKSMQY